MAALAAPGETQRAEVPVLRPVKSPAAFRTISEVADELAVAQHVLRFWESKFPQVRPLKRGGGRRYYRPEDVDQLRQIRVLLYDEGYTIKGVQKLLRAKRGRIGEDSAPPETPAPRTVRRTAVAEAAPVPAVTEAVVAAAPVVEPPIAAVPPMQAELRLHLRAIASELRELRDLLRGIH